MCEQIIAAFIRSDKTKAFCIVKPFNSTGCLKYYFPYLKN